MFAVTADNRPELGFAAALADCRRDATVPSGSIAEIAARHGVDPHELCERWVNDPLFAATIALRAELERRR